MCLSRSYHDGEHYNSVRLKDDPCDGPARSIIIKVLIGILFSIFKIQTSFYLILSYMHSFITSEVDSLINSSL